MSPRADRGDPTPSLGRLKSELLALASPERAKVTAAYFKTGRGEYGEGDRFLGIPVGARRKPRAARISSARA